MKLLTIIACLLFSLTVVAQEEKPFMLSGEIKGGETGRLFVILTDLYGKVKRDTLQLQNGRFLLKGNIPYPMMAFVYTKSPNMDDPNTASFFLDPGNTEITLQDGAFKKAVPTGAGSVTQHDLNAFEALKAVKRNIAGLSPKALQDTLLHTDLAYIAGHPRSHVSAFLLRSDVDKLSLKKGEEYYKLLAPEVQKSGMGSFIRNKLDGQYLGLPGTKAITFTVNDVNGNRLSLGDFKGKYVLLDFWASWCVPCRESHPHLRTLYTKYKSKGLEIIGIADDDTKKEAWKKAIEKDSIGAWRHVLRNLDPEKLAKGDANLLHHPNEISSSKYGIVALPTKILVDPEGKIIARYSGNMADLDKKLETIFKQ
jgi:thiol-disulfide isomerase/thioredoxin